MVKRNDRARMPEEQKTVETGTVFSDHDDVTSWVTFATD